MDLEDRALAAVATAIAQGRLKAIAEQSVIDLFLPLAQRIAKEAERQRPFIVAISGTPGTGKSTLVAYVSVLLEQCFSLRTAGFSIDDLYLSHDERAALGARVHPLLATRGVPGTHDLALGFRTLDALCNATVDTVTPLPRFSKVEDDPWPQERWPRFVGRPDAITIDSWFWQIAPVSEQELTQPLNEREALEDADGSWRRAVNGFLGDGYPQLFDRAHLWVRLAVPSWEATVRWRVEQEADLRAEQAPEKRPTDDPTARLRHFLSLFHRWGVQRAVREPDVTVHLNEDHTGRIAEP